MTGVQHFEVFHNATTVKKHSWQKGSTSQSVPAAESSVTRLFTCDDCSQKFTARIGLVGHFRITQEVEENWSSYIVPTGDSIIIIIVIITIYHLISPLNLIDIWKITTEDNTGVYL